MKRGYADTPHGQIHYREDGTGEAVVMLHQVPTSSEEFALVLPLIGKKRRAIAMDVVGYGCSDKPPRQYTMHEYARTVVDFLDALKIDRAHLVGHHTGAGIVAETAASFPDRVRTLAVSGFPLFNDEDLALRRRGEVPSFLRKSEPLCYKADGSHLTDIWEQTQHIFAWGQEHLKPLDDEQSIERIHSIAMSMLQSGPRNIEGHIALWRWEPKRRLPLIKCPTLIIMTTEDQFVSRSGTISALIPGSRVVVVDQGGSYFPRQQPEQFASLVLDFTGAR